MSSDWMRDYMGRPYRDDAGGPEAFDCKGLVRAVQRRVWAREVPALLHPGLLDDWAALRDACERQGWRPTADAPREGDILSVRSTTGPHVGVFVRVGRRLLVLHAKGHLVRGEQRGSVRLDSLADLLASGYTRPQVWRAIA